MQPCFFSWIGSENLFHFLGGHISSSHSPMFRGFSVNSKKLVIYCYKIYLSSTLYHHTIQHHLDVWIKSYLAHLNEFIESLSLYCMQCWCLSPRPFWPATSVMSRIIQCIYWLAHLNRITHELHITIYPYLRKNWYKG